MARNFKYYTYKPKVYGYMYMPRVFSRQKFRCGKQIKTKGKRTEGIVFTNADPRYAGKLDDPQGGDASMLM